LKWASRPNGKLFRSKWAEGCCPWARSENLANPEILKLYPKLRLQKIQEIFYKSATENREIGMVMALSNLLDEQNPD